MERILLGVRQKATKLTIALLLATSLAHGSEIYSDTDSPIEGDSPLSALFPSGSTLADFGLTAGNPWTYYFNITLSGIHMPAGNSMFGINIFNDPPPGTVVSITATQSAFPIGNYVNCSSIQLTVGAAPTDATLSCNVTGFLQDAGSGSPPQTSISFEFTNPLDFVAGSPCQQCLIQVTSMAVGPGFTFTPAQSTPEPTTAGIVIVSLIVFLIAGQRTLSDAKRFRVSTLTCLPSRLGRLFPGMLNETWQKSAGL